YGAGLFHTLMGSEERAAPLLEESLELARTLGDKSQVARSLVVLGLLAFFRNDMRGARSLLEEGAALARAADDRWCLADALGTLSSIYPLQGEADAAQAAPSARRASRSAAKSATSGSSRTSYGCSPLSRQLRASLRPLGPSQKKASTLRE